MKKHVAFMPDVLSVLLIVLSKHADGITLDLVCCLSSGTFFGAHLCKKIHV